MLRNMVFFLCLATGTLCNAAFKQIYIPGANDPMPVYIFELDNGLRVYLTPNDQKPAFYAEVVVRAGSKDDPAETTGLAHYLEHLMFKGSRRIGTTDYGAEKPHMDRIRDLYEEHFREEVPDRRSEIYREINAETQAMAQYAVPNELDKIYKSFGASDINAHTSIDETVYKVVLPKNRFAQWAELEADRFAEPVFRLFITELETVYEEKNRSMDNKETLLFEGVMKQLFKNHPYGQQTTLGTSEHLKRPSIKNIETFYQSHYVPENMAVIVSGDLEPDAAIKIIDEHFGQWKKSPIPAPKVWDEDPLSSAERVKISYPGEEKALIAFRTASVRSEDADALKLFDMILDNSVAGLINLNLNQNQKVREAGSFPLLMNDYGAQFLWGIPKSGQTLEEVEQLLLDQVALIRNGKFEDWIIPAIVNDFEKMQKLSIEENEGRATLIRDSFVANESWPDAMQTIERMRKLTKQDVVRVANQYFGGGYVSGFRVDEPRTVPFIDKPKIDRVEIDPRRQSVFAKDLSIRPVPDIDPVFVVEGEDYDTYEDAQGSRYYYTKNPINDLFAFSIRIDKGSRHDPRLPVAAQLLEKSGTAQFSPNELKKEWYRLGTDFSVSVGENETVFSLSGLDRNFVPSLELLYDLLNAPQSDQATFEQLVEIVLVQREDAKKDQNTIFAALTQFNRYGNDSRFLKMIPSAELKMLKAQDLLDALSSVLDVKRNVLYAGSLPVAEVLFEFNQAFLNAGPLQDAPPYQYVKARQVDAGEIRLFEKELAQSLVRLEFADGRYVEERIPEVQVFNDYFDGGMGGIVFQELREARSLAYIVGAQYVIPSRPNDENIMVGVVHTQPDKVDEAVVAFSELMDDMPVSEERFRETKASVENQYRTSRLGFRDVLNAVLGWERLGLEVDPRREWFQKIRDLTLEDLLTFHEQRIKDRAKMISIVGDGKRMDMESLKQNGVIIPTSINDLFVE